MFTKSQRKHIRKEKARIRREFFDLKKQEEEISKLYPHTKRGQDARGVQIGEASPRSGVGVYEKVLGKPKVAEIKEQGKIKEEKK